MTQTEVFQKCRCRLQLARENRLRRPREMRDFCREA